MRQDQEQAPTLVIFRKYYDGRIIAIFPEVVASSFSRDCKCYTHLERHGAVDVDALMRNSMPARPAEYADLKAELEGIGYRLEVKQRLTRAMYEKRRREWERIYYS